MTFKKKIDENTEIEIEYSLEDEMGDENFSDTAITINGQKYDLSDPKVLSLMAAFGYLFDFEDFMGYGDKEILADLPDDKLSKAVDEYRNSYNMSAGDDKFDLVYDICNEMKKIN